MTYDADIVVAGAGHNSLLTACYLAKAGYRCLVLDARAIPGGGAATEELLLPGFGIDTCATGHTMIRVNPVLSRDELGLTADYGLRYAEPDPVEHVAFPDGQQFTMWLDRDRTAEEVARFSKPDAAAYLRLLDEYDQVKHIFSQAQFTPVGFGPSLDQMLAEHPQGRIWARRRQLSAVQVVQHEFESRHIQAFLLWMAFQVFQPADEPGSGVLPYAQTFGRQQRSWSIPIGGSGQLTAALTGYLADHGGTVLCGQRVTRLLLEGGRCAGVQTEDGTEYRAGTAVVSTIHVKHLREMAPADAWPEEFHYGVDTYDVGVPGFATYYATHRAAGIPGSGRPAHRRVGGPRGLARGRHPDGGRPAVRAVHGGAAVAAGGHAHPGRPGPGAGWPAHGQAAQPAGVPASGGHGRLGGGQGRARPPDAGAAAPGRARLHRRGDPGQPGQVPRRHRGTQPAHDPRRVPRRQPRSCLQRGAAPGAGLGLAPDAYPGALPDRRDHAPRRIHHRRPRP